MDFGYLIADLVQQSMTVIWRNYMERDCGDENNDMYTVDCVWITWTQLYIWLRRGFQDETLPGPKRELPLDWSRGDAELFIDHFCMEGDNRAALGDLWHDVTCQYIYMLGAPGDKHSPA